MPRKPRFRPVHVRRGERGRHLELARASVERSEEHCIEQELDRPSSAMTGSATQPRTSDGEPHSTTMRAAG
jgi:hypothetical protein